MQYNIGKGKAGVMCTVWGHHTVGKTGEFAEEVHQDVAVQLWGETGDFRFVFY